MTEINNNTVLYIIELLEEVIIKVFKVTKKL